MTESKTKGNIRAFLGGEAEGLRKAADLANDLACSFFRNGSFPGDEAAIKCRDLAMNLQMMADQKDGDRDKVDPPPPPAPIVRSQGLMPAPTFDPITHRPQPDEEEL